MERKNYSPPPKKEEREKVLKRFCVLENRKEDLEANKQRNEERRGRTRRLIERGAVLEDFPLLAPDLSAGAEVKAF